MTRKILVDADLTCHRQTVAIEHPFDWGGGLWTLHSNANDAKPWIERYLDSLKEDLQADEIILCWNDADSGNFRKDWDPDYKGNRLGTRKPLAFYEVREWMKGLWKSYDRPGLEGDDIMGILATHPKVEPADEKIIVSGDKDLLTIPGWHYWPTEGIFHIDEAWANYHFYYQTLIGDQSDGFPGCPGVGPKTAAKALDEDPSWQTVVRIYESKGLNEESAIHQARLARILRADDYDFKTKRPIPWTPEAT